MHSVAFSDQLNMSYYDKRDYTSRMSDSTYGRNNRLSDLLECDDENDEKSPTSSDISSTIGTKSRKTCGTSASCSSLDNLWRSHPNRLTEAGLTRYADSSISLTDDTDSFIIGDRVWVGGTKPGMIAFIGETQFAPGEWAGIALDEPIGKNDGSVAGIRYFQCEPRKGIFSRLRRLSRVPLDGSTDYLIECQSTIPIIERRSVSPTDSLRRSISPSSDGGPTYDFRIGDRVIIKSGQGSKLGYVRYVGRVHFAPGEWCGVELDEARGKNDGSVQGQRYFDCELDYGVFVPVSKISRSPLQYRPGDCQIHQFPRRRRHRDITAPTSTIRSY